jgi:hypothetical protein
MAFVPSEYAFTQSEVCKDFKTNNTVTGQLCEKHLTPTLLGAVGMISVVITVAVIIIWGGIGIICLAEYLRDRFN